MLAYLHGKGVVHRSLGPSSLFLSTNQQDEAERLTVRLVDLGFAASASTLPQEEVENAMRRGASSPLSVLPMLALNDLHGLGYILLELFLSSAAAQVSTRVGTRQVSKKESVARHASHATRLRSSGPPPLLTYSLLLPHRGAGRARCGHGAHHGTAIPKAAGRGHLRGRRVRGLPRVPTHVESQAGAADQRGLASLGQPEACSGAESSLRGASWPKAVPPPCFRHRYCSEEPAWAGAVAMLDEKDGAGWGLLQQLVDCRKGELAGSVTARGLLESCKWFE